MVELSVLLNPDLNILGGVTMLLDILMMEDMGLMDRESRMTSEQDMVDMVDNL